jgi:hypothetical protein
MKTDKEMADHVRAAVDNMNAVLKEAQAEYLKIELTLHGLDGYTGSVSVKCIKVIKDV